MGNGGERFWKLGGFLEIEKKFFFLKKMKLRKKILKILVIRENEKYGIIKNKGGGV